MEVSTYQQQALGFLNKTNTTFNAEFKEFGSMPFDKDGQKRNIFEITLSNANHEYKFDFGTSVMDSVALVPKMTLLKESDKVNFYAGLKSVENQKISAGISIQITKEQLLTKYNIEQLAEQLQNQIDEHIKGVNIGLSEKFDKGDISRNLRNESYLNSVENGVAYQVVNNAFKREIEKLETEMTHSKDLQGDTITTPSEYDVLACLTKYDPYSFEDFCSSYCYDEDSRTAENTYNAVCEEYKNVAMLWNDEELELLQEIS